LLNPLAVVSLLLVVGELIQQITWKIAAQSAMFQRFSLAAIFNRTGFSPKRLANLYATAAVHFFAVFALAANNSAP